MMKSKNLTVAGIVLALFFLLAGGSWAQGEKKVTMDQWINIINSADAKKSPPPKTTEAESGVVESGRPEKVPLPDSSQEQFVEAVKTFRIEAIVEPAATLKKFSSSFALQEFTRLENALFTETPPKIAWKYYFSTATYTIAPLTDQKRAVLFYHPWSDTGIITVWRYRNNRFVITHAELVLGDFIRQYGAPPFELQPLWERESATITPLLALPLAVGETLSAFEKIFPARGKVENDLSVKRRQTFDENAKNEDIRRSMSDAANLRLERAVSALVRYERDKRLEVYRESTFLLLAGVKQGDLSGLKATVPQTSQETFDLISAKSKEIGLFQAASILQTQGDCFVFLSHPADPNNVLVLWFQKDKDKYGLRQANIINHIFSASHIGQIRELVAQVIKPLSNNNLVK